MSEEQKNEKILLRKISIDIFINLLYAVIFMLYYVSLNILEKFMYEQDFSFYIKSSCMVFLSIGIIAFEVGYKKDKGKYWIHGLEFLVLSFYTLMIKYVVRVNELDFEKYILVSSYVFSIYYILKCIIIYTKERKLYLKSLSDIKEIVKKDEPIKKEATKKNKRMNIEEKSNKIQKEENKQQEDKSQKSKEKNKKQEDKSPKNKEKNKKVSKGKKIDEDNKKQKIEKDATKKRGRPKKVTN